MEKKMRGRDWDGILVDTARELFALSVAQSGGFVQDDVRLAADASVLAADELVRALRIKLEGVR